MHGTQPPVPISALDPLPDELLTGQSVVPLLAKDNIDPAKLKTWGMTLDQLVAALGGGGGNGGGGELAPIPTMNTLANLGPLTAVPLAHPIAGPAFKQALALVKADVGLGFVDNTTDANKPVSGPQQAALNLKLDIAAYTAADILAKLLTVDGVDSGLDAALLGGNPAAAFALVSHTHLAAQITDLAQAVNVITHHIAEYGADVRVLSPSLIDGADVAPTISDAFAAGVRVVKIPPGKTYTLNSPIVPKSNCQLILGRGSVLLQKGVAAIATPVGEYLKNFTLDGLAGTIQYDHATPSNKHCALDLGSHAYCNIDGYFMGYAQRTASPPINPIIKAQILLKVKTTDGASMGNTIANRWNIVSDGECGIICWYQGLENFYVETPGTNTANQLIDFAVHPTGFDIRWPADLLVTIWRESTGLLERLPYSTAWNFAAPQPAGTLARPKVNIIAAVPTTDTIMIWPARQTTPKRPVTNNDLRFWVRDCSRASVYGVRYMDSDRITGHARLSADGGAHIWTNPVGLFNAEIDFFTLQAPVLGRDEVRAPTDASVAVCRFGPGTTRIHGSLQFDSGWGPGAAQALEINDAAEGALSGTASNGAGSSTITGASTLWTQQVPTPLPGGSSIRVKFMDATGDVVAIASVNSNSSMTTTAPIAAAHAAGTVIKLVDDTSAVSYAGLAMSHRGKGGNDPPVVYNRKCGHIDGGSHTIVGTGLTHWVAANHAWSRAPLVSELRLTGGNGAAAAVGFRVGGQTELGFNIVLTAAAAGAIYGWAMHQRDM